MKYIKTYKNKIMKKNQIFKKRNKQTCLTQISTITIKFQKECLIKTRDLKVQKITSSKVQQKHNRKAKTFTQLKKT